ncbi:hypothetical protein BJY04DRAFT_71390 [Aspergillus karnatakaensis]|uniref:uncharacterized protein n=1 Tax=Aspergillus karnatakaensis TaxID=1810916 RepID=UPI003CCCD014
MPSINPCTCNRLNRPLQTYHALQNQRRTGTTTYLRRFSKHPNPLYKTIPPLPPFKIPNQSNHNSTSIPPFKDPNAPPVPPLKDPIPPNRPRFKDPNPPPPPRPKNPKSLKKPNPPTPQTTAFQETFSLPITNTALLSEALTVPGTKSLALLGNMILQLAMHIEGHDRRASPAQISSARISRIKHTSLARRYQELGLERFIWADPSLWGELSDRLMVEVVEAIVGAYFEDRGRDFRRLEEVLETLGLGWPELEGESVISVLEGGKKGEEGESAGSVSVSVSEEGRGGIEQASR